MTLATYVRALELGITDEEFACRLCGGPARYEYAYSLDQGVCTACAETISAAYCLEHGSGALEPRRPAPTTTSRRAIPQHVRWRIFERDGFRCLKCGARGVELTIDHIVALANGGADDESNYQTLCRTCNCGKGARDG